MPCGCTGEHPTPVMSLGMDGMGGFPLTGPFLTPRVEFQNKFYSGTGYKLSPFAFTVDSD